MNCYKVFNLIILFYCISLFVSCGYTNEGLKNYLYFQGSADTVKTAVTETVIQPNDYLGIRVFSRTVNQEQAAIFNIPENAENSGYLVDMAGNIELPVIGNVRAAGLTKTQLQESIVQKLNEYVKNPSVVIRFLQFNVNVLGEVRSPGTQKFLKDRVTILDALSAAGDLTDFGMRENITVIRETEGQRIYHIVDLRSRTLFDSPVYVLQPNDIVYVSPNKIKIKALEVDPQAQRKTGLILGIVGSIISLASLVVIVSQ